MPLESGDRFGAALANDGVRLVVGASDAKVLSIYGRVGWNWYLQERVAYVGSEAGQQFGSVVSMAGGLLVSSTPTEPYPNQGRVQVFEGGGGGHTLVATLAGSDAGNYARFGSALATEGTQILASATGVPGSGSSWSNQGAVYVFEKSAGSWTETQRLAASDPGNGDMFGAAMELAGGRLFVGAPDDNRRRIIDTGSVYVFERGGSGYTEVQKLEGTGLVQGSDFGRAIAADSGTLLVGAPGHTLSSPSSEGAVFVYEFVAGAWSEVQVLQAGDPALRNRFGEQVELSGSRALISAPGRNGSTGAVYVFERLTTGWQQVAILERSRGRDKDGFGIAMSMMDVLAIVGAPQTAAGGSVEAFSLDANLCATFSGFPETLSLRDGGAHVLTLDAGLAHAGRTYLVAGTASGTSPGVLQHGARIPLNPDPWFQLTTAGANHGPWTMNLGQLDDDGQAVAWMNLPEMAEPGLLGLELNHAFLVFDGDGELLHVSNTTSLRLLP